MMGKDTHRPWFDPAGTGSYDREAQVKGKMSPIERLEQWVLFPGHLLGPPRGPRPKVEGLERIAIESNEGEVEAWFLPAFGPKPRERRPAVVFGHGNGEVIDEWPQVLEPYRSMGVGVLLPEYRGYGHSAGTPNEAAIVDDFVRFYDELAARPGVDPAKIFVHGRSLGGGAVCALVQHRPVAGLILESTFTSVAAVARRWLVPPFVITNRFDNESVVRAFPRPMLIFHGRGDRVIPYSHSVALQRAANQAKLVSYDCDHNDMVRAPNGYWAEIELYLKTIGVLG